MISRFFGGNNFGVLGAAAVNEKCFCSANFHKFEIGAIKHFRGWHEIVVL